MITIPSSASDIRVEWLRASVRPEDAPVFANLMSVGVERLGEAVAGSTDIHRLVLGYAPGSSPGPATLVAKLPSSSPEVREVARGWSTYRREVLFYRDIACTVALRIPKAYVAEFDPRTEAFVLVMEDLSPATDGDQVAGLPLEHARLALDEIAALHASWWNRPELVALEGAIQPFGEGLWVGTGARHAAAWPLFDKFVAARGSPELRRAGERMADAIEPMMTDMAKAPKTLCHGDFRADNLMFANGGDGGTALITIDWQAPMQARGAFDVGMLMSMSVTTELRRAHEAALLRGYHEKLLAGGVEGYAYDEFFHDYRRGLLIGFTYVVQAGPAADMAHPRTAALFDSAVRRVDAALQDHGLTEFVD
ncbi:MAG: oxidoreductase family protein [Phenylobacterium sp.]